MRQHRQACNYSVVWCFKVSLQRKLKCFFLLFTTPVKPKTHPILRTRCWFTHCASPKGLYLKTKTLPWTWICIWDHCLQTKHFKFKQALEDKVWLCQKNSEKDSSGYRLLHVHPSFPAYSPSFSPPPVTVFCTENRSGTASQGWVFPSLPSALCNQ